jgi:hypothetical protein
MCAYHIQRAYEKRLIWDEMARLRKEKSGDPCSFKVDPEFYG